MIKIVFLKIILVNTLFLFIFSLNSQPLSSYYRTNSLENIANLDPTEQEIYLKIEKTIFSILQTDILSFKTVPNEFMKATRSFIESDQENKENLIVDLKELLIILKRIYVIDTNKKQIVVENLDNFFNILSIFKRTCKDNDRGLCESGIKYLLAQDIYEKAKPYSINEVVISLYRSAVQKPYESNLAKYRDSLYLESLKVTGRTIIDIEYRIEEKSISVDAILNKLCIYKETKISNPRINSFSSTYERVAVEEDICSNLGIKGTLKNYLEKYYKKISESNYKKYSYLEVLNLFNTKINELNKTLELIGVEQECDAASYKTNKELLDSGNIGFSLRAGQAGGLDPNNYKVSLYSLGDGYRRNDSQSSIREINELDTLIYNVYKDLYYNLASSPIGSIIFSKHMQGVDKDKKYYDQGLRLLRREGGFLGNVGIMMNDAGRMMGDWDNVGREVKLLCSRYHKDVSIEQVKEAVADTINNLYAFATYASMNVYKSSTIGYGLSYYKAVRRLIMFSPILIGDLLKHNGNLRGDLVELINDIKVVDKQEEITVNVLRGVGVLSIVALPLGGAVAGWTGSALAGFVVRGAGAVAGMVSSVSEIRYAGVLSQEVKFRGARLASVFKAFEELEANQVYQRNNIAFSDFYLKVQEEAHINRLLLVLDIVGLVGDGFEVVKYIRSTSRLKSLSSTLNLSDFSRLIDTIHETGRSRKISGNIMMALSEISRAEDRLAIINNLTKRSDLLDFLNTHASGFSIKSLQAEFRNILRELEAANSLLEVRYLDDYSSINIRNKNDIIREYFGLSESKKNLFEKNLNENIIEGRIRIEGIDKKALFHEGSFKNIDEILNSYYKNLNNYAYSDKEKQLIRELVENIRSKEFFYVYLKDDLNKLLNSKIPWKDKEKYLVNIITNHNSDTNSKNRINNIFKQLFDRVVEFDLNDAYKNKKGDYAVYVAKWSDICKNLDDTTFKLRGLGYQFEIIDNYTIDSSIMYNVVDRKLIKVTGIRNENLIRKTAKFNEDFIESEAFYRLVKSGQDVYIDPGMDIIRSRAEAQTFQFKSKLKRYIFDHEVAHKIEIRFNNDLGPYYEDFFKLITTNNALEDNKLYQKIIELLRKNGKNINSIDELLNEYSILDDIIFVMKKMHNKFKIENAYHLDNYLPFFKEYIATRRAIKNMELNVMFRMFSKEYRLQRLYRYKYLRSAQEQGFTKGLDLFQKIEEKVFKLLGEDYYKKGYYYEAPKILEKFDKEMEKFVISALPLIVLLSNKNSYAGEISNDFDILEIQQEELFDVDMIYGFIIGVDDTDNKQILNINYEDKIIIDIERLEK